MQGEYNHDIDTKDLQMCSIRKRYKVKCVSYEHGTQVYRGELLNEILASHIQQHSSPEVAQMLQRSRLHDGVELQAAAGNSCCHHQYPNRHPRDTLATADYQKMIWLGSGHASPDVHDDVWVRLVNWALSERGESRLVGNQRDRRAGAGVQEKVQPEFPRKANGYHGVVSTAETAEVVASLEDNVNNLKKKASAHQLFKKKNGDRIPC